MSSLELHIGKLVKSKKTLEDILATANMDDVNLYDRPEYWLMDEYEDKYIVLDGVLYDVVAKDYAEDYITKLTPTEDGFEITSYFWNGGTSLSECILKAYNKLKLKE